MTPDITRRDALRYVAVSTPLLAGCSGSTDDDGTPYPDAGTDTYGIRVENRSPENYQGGTPTRYGHPPPKPEDLIFEIELEVRYSFSNEGPLWQETVVLEPGESTKWTSVITENREHVVSAKLPNRDPGWDTGAATHWITPGSEDAPDVAFLNVVTDYSSVDSPWRDDEKSIEIYITHEEADYDN